MGYFLMTQILREEKHTSVTLEDYKVFNVLFQLDKQLYTPIMECFIS